MKKWIFFLVTAGFLAGFNGGDLQAADKTKMVQDLDIVKNIFEVKYAPFEWKKQYSGWDLATQIDLAKSRIDASGELTVKDYQKILHSFFISTSDYHVQDIYFSTERAFLPFRIRSLGGKYYVTDVNTDMLKAMHKAGLYSSPDTILVGDEILTFNGQSIQEAVKEVVVTEVGDPNSATAQGLGEILLTVRIGALGHTVPQGPVSITFRHHGKDVQSIECEWLYVPEEIKNKFKGDGACDVLTAPYEKGTKKIYNKMMVSPLSVELQKEWSKTKALAAFEKKGDAEEDAIVRNERSDTTTVRDTKLVLGKAIWQSKSPRFHAYIYESPGLRKKIGYIRLDTYSPHDHNGPLASDYASELSQILSHLQKQSDALVIDQVNNPGGYVMYVYAVLSMLSENPMNVPTHRLTITQRDVSEAIQDLDELENDDGSPGVVLGYNIDADFINCMKDYNKFVISEWQDDKTFTSPFYLYGLEAIKPHPRVRYTKPILILVDRNCFSGGDFLPAILQDNKRATVFGEKTAGAGGAVDVMDYPNLFGVKMFTYTSTYAQRLDGQPIENLGVQPDVPYELTVDDIMQGYKGYAKAVNEAVENLIKK